MSNEIEQITKTLIEAKILEALRETPEYIDSLVKGAINQEVDERGNKPTYSSDETMPYLQYLVRDALQRLAREVVQEVVKEGREDMKRKIREALQADKIVNAFADSVIKNAETWNIAFDIKVPVKDDEY